mmetsp:Transcript_20540/g.78716  ORF Transcript_20540/g.78716 Transcript_20540/m.78716 type:complete len:288 (-) Transcript_20540:1508-2371(-)
MAVGWLLAVGLGGAGADLGLGAPALLLEVGIACASGVGRELSAHLRREALDARRELRHRLAAPLHRRRGHLTPLWRWLSAEAGRPLLSTSSSAAAAVRPSGRPRGAHGIRGPLGLAAGPLDTGRRRHGGHGLLAAVDRGGRGAHARGALAVGGRRLGSGRAPVCLDEAHVDVGQQLAEGVVELLRITVRRRSAATAAVAAATIGTGTAAATAARGRQVLGEVVARAPAGASASGGGDLGLRGLAAVLLAARPCAVAGAGVLLLGRRVYEQLREAALHLLPGVEAKVV